MYTIEKSGIYRDAKGRGIKLFAGAVISDEQAAKYSIGSEVGAEVGEPIEVPANPTDSIEETPTGEPQEGMPDEGAEVRDGVIADGVGGEVGVSSTVVEVRDDAPVDGSSTPSEIRQLGPAPENRMQPAPSENRGNKRKRSSNATTDAELSADENAEPTAPADSLDDKDAK